jgi:hypothetical protein
MREAKRQENQGKYQTPWMIDDLSGRDAKRELGKRAPLMTLEEFKTSRRNPSAFLVDARFRRVGRSAGCACRGGHLRATQEPASGFGW